MRPRVRAPDAQRDPTRTTLLLGMCRSCPAPLQSWTHVGPELSPRGVSPFVRRALCAYLTEIQALGCSS